MLACLMFKLFKFVYFRQVKSNLFNYELHRKQKYLTGPNYKQNLLTKPHTLTPVRDFVL